MRVLFLGTAEIALPALQRLHQQEGVELVGVISQPDRPAGRARSLRASPVKEEAIALGLACITPEKVGALEVQEQVRTWAPDLLVVVAYGQYIPECILKLAPHRGINLHPSLLPKYRGSSPIQWALLQGDRETGVSIIRVAKEMDAGDILLQERYTIQADEHAGSLHDALSHLGAELLCKTIDLITKDALEPRMQNEAEVIHTQKLSKSDGCMDWHLSAQTLHNRVRAFHPWPGSYTLLPDGRRLQVHAVVVEPGEGEPGCLIDERLCVATQEGALRLLEVQLPGKKRMEAAAFLRGCPLAIGDRLG